MTKLYDEALYKKSKILKLVECRHGGEVVDNYSEYEGTIIFLDLVLQNVAACRHVLVNNSHTNTIVKMTLQVLTQLVSAATSLRTSPPPAKAAALAAQCRDDLQRCGRVTSQLRKVVKQLEGCSQQLARLYESSFDADTASLAQLSMLQQATSSLEQWIEMVCLKSSLQVILLKRKSAKRGVFLKNC